MSKEAKMDRDDVEAFLDREFPQLHHLGRLFSVGSVRFGLELSLAFCLKSNSIFFKNKNI